MNIAAHSLRDSRSSKVGIALMLLGALFVAAGIVQTTSSNPNQSCPDGSVLLSKYNNDAGWVFEKPAGNENVVTLTNNTPTGATWHSTLAVSYIIIKGGTGTELISLAPPQYDGSFTNAGLPPVGAGNLPNISNVQWCGADNQSTTTSASSTSSSTSTSTTTTPSSSTSTSTSTSSTTTPSSSSTSTSHPTTSTSTTSTSTTTTPSSSTSTTPHETTSTTQPHGTTTTEPASTSTVKRSGSTVEASTTTKPGPVVTSTTVFTGDQGTKLPFTGGQSLPLLILGILSLATGFALTFSATRRGRTARS